MRTALRLTAAVASRCCLRAPVSRSVRGLLSAAQQRSVAGRSLQRAANPPTWQAWSSSAGTIRCAASAARAAPTTMVKEHSSFSNKDEAAVVHSDFGGWLGPHVSCTVCALFGVLHSVCPALVQDRRWSGI